MGILYIPPSASQTGGAYTPGRHDLTAWSIQPHNCPTSATLTAGQARYFRVPIPATFTITKVWTHIATAGTGSPALANCYLAVYNTTGTRLGVTGDLSTPWASAGTQSATCNPAAAGSLNVTVGTYVWVGVLVGTQSATPVQHISNNAQAAAQNANVTQAGTLGTGLSALPDTITPASITPAGIYWVALT